MLPAEEEELDYAKERLGIESFTEATITKVEFGKPYSMRISNQSSALNKEASARYSLFKMT